MEFVRVTLTRRWLVVLSCLFVVLGPLSASTYSAATPIRLTFTQDVVQYEWSPKGDALYFTRAEGVVQLPPFRALTRTALYRIASSGGTPKQLVANGGMPAPAPDGNHLAFVSLLDDGTGRLGLLDLSNDSTIDFGSATWGHSPQWTLGGGSIIYGLQGTAVDISPATTKRGRRVNGTIPPTFSASPIGDRVAYADLTGLHISTETGDAVVFQAAGSVRLTTDQKWSRDGSKLAFVVTRGGHAPELWVVNSDGSHSRMLNRGGTEYLTGIDWSSDNSKLLFTRTPTGSSIANRSDIWTACVDGTCLAPVTRNNEEESSPKFSPDGSLLSFLREGDLWVMPLAASIPPSSATAQGPGQPRPPEVNRPGAPAAQLTPPVIIRVYHDPNNSCRANEAVGQIDSIDFETYVKHVVPAEVYSSWPAEALKTQAVAARSYAWFWVLQHVGQAWDVKDWTNYQVMCDATAQSTNSAVDATKGQYGDYGGNVIFAAYGADNGDPTVTNNWGNPYLIGVDDPPAFGDTVAGNGIGMSQWGANYWASLPYSWNYQQILMHYYSGVTVESPARSTPDAAAPIAGMVMPWSHWGVTSNHLYLSASASDNSSNIDSVSLIAKYFDGTKNQTVNLAPTYDGNYWNYVADLSSIPDQTGISIVLYVTDASGYSFNGNGVSFTLDRSNPGGTVSAPASSTSQNVTLTLNASDSGPGGLAQMAFSNNWIWQGENQSVTIGSGNVVDDPAALDGKALSGRVGTNPPGLWYGPDTSVLELASPYRAYFRLKTDNVLASSQVATLDVTDAGGNNIFGLKRLRGTDFRSANTYQEFYVDFNPPGWATQGLEFRVAYLGTANLWLDRIIVLSYPVAYSTTSQWTLTAGDGFKTIQAKFIDGAGNISADATTVIRVGPAPTASFTATATRTSTPNFTATATGTPTLTPTRTPTPILTPSIWLPFVTH